MRIFKKTNDVGKSSGIASFSDVRYWQTMTVQEQDIAIGNLQVSLGKVYRHVRTCSYEAYGTNKSLRIPTFKHVPTGIEFNLIMGGGYNMGFSVQEEEAMLTIDQDAFFTKEVLPPPKIVQVRPFLMSRLPVLDGLARKLLDVDPNLFRPEFSRNPKDRVPIYLSRGETLSLLKATGFDMPSEAQWEYAYRGLSTSLFPFGNNLPSREILGKLFLDVFNNQDQCLEAANPFGLLGMYIGEWCQDSFYSDRNAKHPCSDDQPACNGSPYVVRGGASSIWPWQSGNEWIACMSAARWNSGTLEDGTCGVRLVKRIEIEA